MNHHETLRLTEYQDSRTLLSEADRAYLKTRFSTKLSLRQELVDGVVTDVINPGPHVGVLTLPSGRRLQAQPKIEAANVFYMMSVAYELPELMDESAHYDDMADVIEFIVDRFATMTEERLRLGLFRRYVEKEENLSLLRGRIVFARDIPQNFASRHRTYCEYSELSWDIPENQVIRQVAAHLSVWPFRRELRSRLAGIDSTMEEVSLSRHRADVIDGFVYDRLNMDYRSLHQLCHLLMDASSLSEDEGAFTFETFLVDMNHLFEQFVTQTLLGGMNYPWRVQGQYHTHLDTSKEVTIIPDIVLQQGSHLCGLLDAKYKKLEQVELRNNDIYQVLSYCVSMALDRGMIVYPTHLVDRNEDLTIRNSPIKIRVHSLDLSGDIVSLKAHMNSFLTTVLAWAQTGKPLEPVLRI